jgi:hypothetical protein
MQHRIEWLDSFDKKIEEHSMVLCVELCFKILYGLPQAVQIELTCFMMRRYLPIFESKWPDIKWLQQLLNNVALWVKDFGRSVPEEPVKSDPADTAFLFCFDALLLAYCYRANQMILTSSCACAINSAISARKTNVWIADDPEGLTMWRGQGYFPGRSVNENAAAIAVEKREWKVVSQWLRGEKEIWIHPETAPLGEIEKALTIWKEHEMLLIVPKKNSE